MTICIKSLLFRKIYFKLNIISPQAIANNILDHMLWINMPNIAASIFFAKTCPTLMWEWEAWRVRRVEFSTRPPRIRTWQNPENLASPDLTLFWVISIVICIPLIHFFPSGLETSTNRYANNGRPHFGWLWKANSLLLVLVTTFLGDGFWKWLVSIRCWSGMKTQCWCLRWVFLPTSLSSTSCPAQVLQFIAHHNPHPRTVQEQLH